MKIFVALLVFVGITLLYIEENKASKYSYPLVKEVEVVVHGIHENKVEVSIKTNNDFYYGKLITHFCSISKDGIVLDDNNKAIFKFENYKKVKDCQILRGS